MAIIQMITGVIVWFRPDERLSVDEVTETYLAMTMRLVGAQRQAEMRRKTMYTNTLNFGLGEDIEALRDMVRRFAQERIAPLAAEIDRSNEFPAHLWKELGALGLLGITADPDFGGSGMGYLAHVDRGGGDFAAPRPRSACPTARIPISASTRSTAGARPSRRRNTCRRCARGEKVGALAMSESGSGSDVVSMRLRAEKSNDRYVLNGTKMWITNGPDADTLVVYAKTDPERNSRGITAFIVEKDDRRASRWRRSSTSSACAAPTPANWCSRMSRCRSKTCCTRKAAASRC